MKSSLKTNITRLEGINKNAQQLHKEVESNRDYVKSLRLNFKKRLSSEKAKPTKYEDGLRQNRKLNMNLASEVSNIRDLANYKSTKSRKFKSGICTPVLNSTQEIFSLSPAHKVTEKKTNSDKNNLLFQFNPSMNGRKNDFRSSFMLNDQSNISHLQIPNIEGDSVSSESLELESSIHLTHKKVKHDSGFIQRKSNEVKLTKSFNEKIDSRDFLNRSIGN
mmetsp:Transcript_18127/g.20297  ORF Transcript_18127/g.20297 Transcript_18127/m.20297 type:complete len:220 (-) Transcript_18127:548-1207(-)